MGKAALRIGEEPVQALKEGCLTCRFLLLWILTVSGLQSQSNRQGNCSLTPMGEFLRSIFCHSTSVLSIFNNSLPDYSGQQTAGVLSSHSQG